MYDWRYLVQTMAHVHPMLPKVEVIIKNQTQESGCLLSVIWIYLVYHICHFAFGMLSQVLLQGKTRTNRQNFELHTYLQIGSIDFKLWLRFQTIANVRLT